MTSFNALQNSLLNSPSSDNEPPYEDLYSSSDHIMGCLTTNTRMHPSVVSSACIVSYTPTHHVTSSQAPVTIRSTAPSKTSPGVPGPSYSSCRICPAIDSNSAPAFIYRNSVLFNPSRLTQPQAFKFSVFFFYIHLQCNYAVSLDIMYSCPRCNGTITLQSGQYSVNYLVSLIRTFLQSHKLF